MFSIKLFAVLALVVTSASIISAASGPTTTTPGVKKIREKHGIMVGEGTRSSNPASFYYTSVKGTMSPGGKNGYVRTTLKDGGRNAIHHRTETIVDGEKTISSGAGAAPKRSVSRL